MAIAITVLYVALVFGLYVSNWEFEIQTSNSTLSIPSNSIETKMVRRESSIYSNYLYNEELSYVRQHFLLLILYIIFKALIT
jgi:hypothetical protein